MYVCNKKDEIKFGYSKPMLPKGLKLSKIEEMQVQEVQIRTHSRFEFQLRHSN